jgi:hypothetical protein
MAAANLWARGYSPGLAVDVGLSLGAAVGASTAGGASGMDAGDSTTGPGARDGTTTGSVELVGEGTRGTSAGGLGLCSTVAMATPSTIRHRIVITIPRTDVCSFRFSKFIHPMG